MDIPVMRDEEQKQSPGKSTPKDVVSESASVAGSDRATNGRALHKDQHAAQKLARTKRLKAAHRRQLRAPHAKG